MSIEPLKNPVQLTAYFELKYVPYNLNLAENSAEQYRVTLRQLDAWNKSPVAVTELSDSLILKFMRWLKSIGRSERTANNKRQAILTLWRHAAHVHKMLDAPPPIPKMEEPRRIVQAWTVADVCRLIEVSRFAKPLGEWDWRHWQALILVIYDTSHRIGALLDATRDALNMSTGHLLLKAEWTKQKSDTQHKLHPDTLAALALLPKSKCGKLFAWPRRKRAIWAEFRKILESGGLRATRKDLFHKLRRTSFTYVYALLGESAAREQAGHSSNVTASYLDKALLASLQNKPAPVDVLPRPKT